jgi:large repetitive protein
MSIPVRLSLGVVLLASSWLLAGCSPDARFSINPISGNAPLDVEFTDQSVTLFLGFIDISVLMPVREWRWDFGDGAGSTAQDPDHTYAYAGDYEVTLTAYTRLSSHSRTAMIGVDAITPTANFTFSQDSADPLTLHFNDTSVAGSYPILTWMWDFGLGAFSTLPNPSHTFPVPGQYTVRLTITTAAGSNTMTRSDVNITLPPVAPKADFTFEPDPANPLLIRFTDTSDPGSEAISSWQWTFGDGGSDAVQHPVRMYSAPGAYSVKLTVTTAAGTNARTKTVTVTSPK